VGRRNSTATNGHDAGGPDGVAQVHVVRLVEEDRTERKHSEHGEYAGDHVVKAEGEECHPEDWHRRNEGDEPHRISIDARPAPLLAVGS